MTDVGIVASTPGSMGSGDSRSRAILSGAAGGRSLREPRRAAAIDGRPQQAGGPPQPRGCSEPGYQSAPIRFLASHLASPLGADSSAPALGALNPIFDPRAWPLDEVCDSGGRDRRVTPTRLPISGRRAFQAAEGGPVGLGGTSSPSHRSDSQAERTSVSLQPHNEVACINEPCRGAGKKENQVRCRERTK